MGCPVCCCRAPSQFGMQRGVDTPGNSVINADGHLNRVDTPVTPSSTPPVTSTASSDRSAVYKEAAAYLQSFLASWQKDGLYAAGQKYLDPSMRADQTQG